MCLSLDIRVIALPDPTRKLVDFLCTSRLNEEAAYRCSSAVLHNAAYPRSQDLNAKVGLILSK
jgi:hypothetical protein